MNPTPAERDRPWIMRTYSGHSTAAASNELYRTNLGKGQTGLSIAFDLPTQTGYDPDHPPARGEVGKVVFCAEDVPAWNPVNIRSYHLQEAGATPVQEVAFALDTAVDLLDCDLGAIVAELTELALARRV